MLDIHGNNGRGDIAPLDWFVNFIWEAPKVQRTCIKLASLINNHITPIAAKNIDYENLFMGLKKEYNKAQEILDKISEIDIDKKIQQALLFKSSGEYEKAYSIYESKLWKDSYEVFGTLSFIINLLYKENKFNEV
ncbi:hypothetical protein [Clostridium paraputrificum]|uniref:hypothetical protein n=1 Tax=Clostridium paraputrificum TaxID=29363 RepID=UPI00374E6BE7